LWGLEVINYSTGLGGDKERIFRAFWGAKKLPGEGVILIWPERLGFKRGYLRGKIVQGE